MSWTICLALLLGSVGITLVFLVVRVPWNLDLETILPLLLIFPSLFLGASVGIISIRYKIMQWIGPQTILFFIMIGWFISFILSSIDLFILKAYINSKDRKDGKSRRLRLPGFYPQPGRVRVPHSEDIELDISLRCPEIVLVDVEFPLEIQQPKRSLDASHAKGYEGQILTVQLIAEGFNLRPGQLWRREIRATSGSIRREKRLAVYHLKAEPAIGPTETEVRLLQVLISTAGEVLGAWERPVAVVNDKDELEEYLRRGPRTNPSDSDVADAHQTVQGYLGKRKFEGKVTIPRRNKLRPPDLTVYIRYIHHLPAGALNWTMTSPHSEVMSEIPQKPPATYLGADAKDFTLDLVKKLSEQDGKQDRYHVFLGACAPIRDKTPPEFWNVLSRARQVAGNRPPSILLLTEESYVPWELAPVGEMIKNAVSPPILGAQALVGRWLLDQRGNPVKNPVWEKTVERIAIFSGVYSDSGSRYKRLEQAEEEAKLLAKDFIGTQYEATLDNVLHCLETSSHPYDVLHFAVHGRYNPGGLEDGLILEDNQVFGPNNVRGRQLLGNPFVFLNACQVGGGSEKLGVQSGLAQAFIHAGASAVVAPLWSIRDTVSKEIALNFYRELAKEKTLHKPAAALRRIRAEFRPPESDEDLNKVEKTLTEEPKHRDLTSLTRVAYIFYGHPEFRLHLRMASERSTRRA